MNWREVRKNVYIVNILIQLLLFLSSSVDYICTQYSNIIVVIKTHQKMNTKTEQKAKENYPTKNY